MGERKGVNKYYPPDWRPEMGSINKYHGTHALRERARKLPQGILIIRFEMPYNIWCAGCENHIGTGVRYNAEKKKVGMYYSTPIYQFRMKCHLCNNHFEIKTDPQNFDYEIVTGARRQERRWDPTENEQVVPEDKNDSKKLLTDPMFRLEHDVDDKGKSKSAAPNLARLEDLQDRHRDDYQANKVLRQIFRDRKKEQQAKRNADKSLLDKSSLNIPLVEEDPQDIRIAGLLQYTSAQSFEEAQKQRRDEIQSRSWFRTSTPIEATTSPRGCVPSSTKSGARLPKLLHKIASKAIAGVTLKTLSGADLGIVANHNGRTVTDCSEEKMLTYVTDCESSTARPSTDVSNQMSDLGLQHQDASSKSHDANLESSNRSDVTLNASVNTSDKRLVSLVSAEYGESDSN